jgi:site-specific DNA-methyltransferase (adenine-specific)
MIRIWNEDCVEGARKHLADREVDLLICDPPFGIGGAALDKHYNRDEDNVLGGYVEAPQDYYTFSLRWLAEARRVLKDDGSLYVLSGWTNLRHLLNAAHDLDWYLINHPIWHYNFGVYTKKKYVSAHYDILYLKKSRSAQVKFNTYCRFTGARDATGSPLYRDLQDVWVIKREYHPGELKNRNKLPDALVEKMVAYSSDEHDVVGDFFLGNFTTATVALRMNRVPVGFEVNQAAYAYHMPRLQAQVGQPPLSDNPAA